ncbi:MAG: hypothetical protein KAI67_03295 [Candidatus Pacebacteria bacterium]|nr:hypothetical protein [Candidatus Paceibacterota bacterium]
MRLKKEGEGVFEIFLNIFMPIWLPIRAIQMMLKEIKDEKRKREEMEK